MPRTSEYASAWPQSTLWSETECRRDLLGHLMVLAEMLPAVLEERHQQRERLDHAAHPTQHPEPERAVEAGGKSVAMIRSTGSEPILQQTIELFHRIVEAT